MPRLSKGRSSSFTCCQSKRISAVDVSEVQVACRLHRHAHAAAACTWCARAHSASPPAQRRANAAVRRWVPPRQCNQPRACYAPRRRPRVQHPRAARRRTPERPRRSRTPPGAAPLATRPPCRAPVAYAAPMRCVGPASREAGEQKRPKQQLRQPPAAAGSIRIRRGQHPTHPAVAPPAGGCQTRRRRPRGRSALSRGRTWRPRPAAAVCQARNAACP